MQPAFLHYQTLGRQQVRSYLNCDSGDRVKGFAVNLAAIPAAITTIIVSPIALDTANKTAPTIPGRAAGSNF